MYYTTVFCDDKHAFSIYTKFIYCNNFTSVLFCLVTTDWIFRNMFCIALDFLKHMYPLQVGGGGFSLSFLIKE